MSLVHRIVGICGTSAGADVWHSFVAPCTGRVSFDTCGSSFDTVLELYEGTCAALVSVACSDDACGLESVVSHRLTLGTTYYLRVGSNGGAEAGHEEHHADELRALLASRGRAVTAHDYRELSRAFDPGRIAAVSVGRGVARVDRGVTTCVQVDVDCQPGAFTGRLEREEFQRALLQYLRNRAPAGQAIVVNLREA